jgi:hypothetical protein
MTISSPTFQRLQSGIKSADDLRVKEPINAMMTWLSGDLVTQLNTHFGAVSNSISSAFTAFLNTANTFNAAQTISISATGTFLTLRSSDGGAGEGPTLLLDRNSATPAAVDVIGSIRFNGRDSGGGTETYAAIAGLIQDPTAASEDGWLLIRTRRAGADADWYMRSGTLFYSTQTEPGNAGEIAAVAYKVGASQVVGARITGWGDPFGATSRATFSTTTATANQVAQALGALILDLKTHGVIGT